MRKTAARLAFAWMIIGLSGTAARADIFGFPMPTSVLFDDSTDQLAISFDGAAPELVGGEAFFSAWLPNLPILGITFQNLNVYDAGGVLSDTIGLEHTTVAGLDFVRFAFRSDASGVPLTALNQAATILETGDIQDAGVLSWVGGSTNIQFRSDAGEASLTEPATWSVLVPGLFVMIFVRRKLVRRAALRLS